MDSTGGGLSVDRQANPLQRADLNDKQPLSYSSQQDRVASSPAPAPSRSLLSIQPESSLALQAPSRSVRLTPLLSPTSLEQHPSRANGFEHILNPPGRVTTGASNLKYDADGLDTPRTTMIASEASPAAAPSPSASTKKSRSGDVSLPSIVTALTNEHPHTHSLSGSMISRSSTSHGGNVVLNGMPTASGNPLQAAAVLPRTSTSMGPGVPPPLEVKTSPSMPRAAHPPPALLPQNNPWTPAQIPEAPHQGPCQMLTLHMEQGSIQVPLDTHAASKVADEKRKRNATASHRFRQRRKERERETSSIILALEVQVQERTEEKDYYLQERDFLRHIILQHRIPIPPRPPSPRRRKDASPGEPQAPGTETSAQTGDRNSLRGVIPQGQPPQSIATPLALRLDTASASTYAILS